MNPDEVDMVIYHGDCVDGYASAYCAFEYFSKKEDKREIIYYAGSYNNPPPLKEATGKCVLMCDFSYKKTELLKLIEVTKKFLILDHHKTAENDLLELPNHQKVFRMDHSGSYITYRYFNKNTSIPLMIIYIEDNDIWLKRQPHTREFTAYMSTLPFTFEEYGKIMDDNFVKNEVFSQGTVMVRQNDIIISKNIKKAVPKFVQIKDKYYFVAHLNSTVLVSELGNNIFNEYPDINFSAVYSINDYSNTTTFSLRSNDTSTDVSEIALIYGGGGHRNASGCSLSYVTNMISRVLNTCEIYNMLSTIYFRNVMVLMDNTEIVDSKTNSDENLKNVNIVLLNSAQYQNELGKYLLQIRYKSLDNKFIQEATSIYLNKCIKDNKINIVTSPQDMSVIWSYDGYSDKTSHTVTFNDNQASDIKLIIYLKKYLKKRIKQLGDICSNYEETEDRIVFTTNSLKMLFH